ncbi:MAG: UpxY family transcription antiterminator [Bacteroidota bacterium]
MYLQKPIYKWYAIYTKANNEKKVFDRLKEDDIECYLPLKKTLRQWSDRKKWIDVPLFRCYVFVKVSYIEFFRALKIPGVVYYVSFGGEPQSIPDNQIEYIQRLAEQKDREIEVSYNTIKKGSEAEILIGPLKGLQGEVVRLNGQNRLLIRLMSMGLSIHANVLKGEVKLLKTEKKRKETSRHYRTLQNSPYRKNSVLASD